MVRRDDVCTEGAGDWKQDEEGDDVVEVRRDRMALSQKRIEGIVVVKMKEKWQDANQERVFIVVWRHATCGGKQHIGGRWCHVWLLSSLPLDETLFLLSRFCAFLWNTQYITFFSCHRQDHTLQMSPVSRIRNVIISLFTCCEYQMIHRDTTMMSVFVITPTAKVIHTCWKQHETKVASISVYEIKKWWDETSIFCSGSKW